jgi:ElaA protein
VDAGAPTLDWRLAPFAALSPHELRRIYALRQAVFVVEQACPFLDADERDEQALHLAAWRSGEALPLACARLLAPGVAAAEASIGRVATARSARGTGLGRETMRRAVAAAEAAWPGAGLHLSAQSRLERFYEGFGFVAAGPRYLEDGIDHTPMRRATMG